MKGAGKHASGDYLQNRAIATLVRDTVRPRSDLVHARTDLVARLSDDEAGVLLTLEFATAVGHSIPKKQKEVCERYEDALEVVRDVYVQELIHKYAGRSLPSELVDLVEGRQPVLPRQWDLSEVVARMVVLTYSNAVAPYEIDTGDAAVEAIPHVMRMLGYPSGTATKVQDVIRSVNAHLDSRRTLFGTKTRWAMAAAGVALLAAGPVGLAMAGAAGTVGAAAITSGLAAFGPGGMAGGLAMLSGLAGTGGMVAAAAATARPGNSTVLLDPTSIAIQVAIAHSLKSVGEAHDFGLWERVVIAENELSAQINRLAPFSDPKAPTLVKLYAARDTITSLLGYMREHDLIPAVIVPAVSDSDAVSDSPEGPVATFQIGKPMAKLFAKKE